MVFAFMPQTSTSLKAYVLRYGRWAVPGFISVVGAMGLGLWIPDILRRIIDGLESSTFSQPDLIKLSIKFLGVSLLAALFSVFMRRILLGLAQWVEFDIRRDVFAHLTRMDYGFFQRERTGDIMTKMSSDLFSIKEMIGQGLLQGSRILISFPLAFGIMFHINTTLALTIMAIIPVISFVFFIIIRMIRARYDAAQEQFSTISNFCQENFSGFRTVKGFGVEQRMRDIFRTHNQKYIDLNMALTRVEEPIWPFMIFMFGVGTLLLLLVGGRQVINGQLTLGEFVQVNQYLLFLQWPMLALGWTSNLFQRGIASWKRVRTILDAQPDIRDGSLTDSAAKVVGGNIEIKNAGYRVDDRDLVSGIDLSIPEGQVLGITGPTGSGKTLLISLICRLIDPTTGTVSIGGRDIRAYPLALLRGQIGLAPQEAFLFSDTLANNIAFGLAPGSAGGGSSGGRTPPVGIDLGAIRDAEPDHSHLHPHEEKILWAAGVAHLREDVEQFPLKFATMLGERGVTLSGGQRQRTAISRAIALDPSILILDDVFSAVDTQTEAKILSQLLPVLRQRTAILVSHRVSTLKHADRIIVMEKGRIVQDGTHEQLIAQPGYYREQDEMQRLEARLEGDVS